MFSVMLTIVQLLTQTSSYVSGETQGPVLIKCERNQVTSAQLGETCEL